MKFLKTTKTKSILSWMLILPLIAATVFSSCEKDAGMLDSNSSEIQIERLGASIWDLVSIDVEFGEAVIVQDADGVHKTLCEGAWGVCRMSAHIGLLSSGAYHDPNSNTLVCRLDFTEYSVNQVMPSINQGEFNQVGTIHLPNDLCQKLGLPNNTKVHPGKYSATVDAQGVTIYFDL